MVRVGGSKNSKIWPRGYLAPFSRSFFFPLFLFPVLFAPMRAKVLGITQRCIDFVVFRASLADQALFGWPVSGAAAFASIQVL